jgi:hypothetical protein
MRMESTNRVGGASILATVRARIWALCSCPQLTPTVIRRLQPYSSRSERLVSTTVAAIQTIGPRRRVHPTSSCQRGLQSNYYGPHVAFQADTILSTEPNKYDWHYLDFVGRGRRVDSEAPVSTQPASELPATLIPDSTTLHPASNPATLKWNPSNGRHPQIWSNSGCSSRP